MTFLTEKPARSIDAEKYLRNLELEQFLQKLDVSDFKALAKTAEHFTLKEAEKRDEIVISYFGHNGVDRIVNTVTKHLLEPPKLPQNAKILDVGAGTGFFTTRIAEKLHLKMPGTSFYAMDLTPAMLLSLAKKNVGITPFLGVAENIEGSIEQARNHFNVPKKFDAVFSTLMLHHSHQPEKIFKNIKSVLKRKGKAIVIDMCEHSFEEFRVEMGDVHLGFKPEDIYEMMKKDFSEVKVRRAPGISCKSSGRSIQLFVATMKNFS